MSECEGHAHCGAIATASIFDLSPWHRACNNGPSMNIPNLDAILAAQQPWRLAARADDLAARSAAEQACTTMSEAIDVLAGNLATIGYPRFAGRIPSTPGLARRIRKIERRLGMPLPPALKVFWRIVGGVSFVDLTDYAHVRFWHEQGLAEVHCDGLYLDGCDDDWFDCMLDELDARRAAAADKGAPEPFELPLSPDGPHKDNVSGGPPYAVIPGNDWLLPLRHYRWRGITRTHTAPAKSCDLIGYLRTTILECAGFPGLFGQDKFEPIRQRLLEDVPVF